MGSVAATGPASSCLVAMCLFCCQRRGGLGWAGNGHRAGSGAALLQRLSLERGEGSAMFASAQLSGSVVQCR